MNRIPDSRAFPAYSVKTPGRSFLAAILGGLLFLTWAMPPAHASRLTELSLEELLDLEVTLVSKRPERLSEAPAAVHVITREDIRRSGGRSIPDLLRQAPGVEVAQLTSSSWAVSARGFNDIFANKLLVMIDGRTIYTPLFSGVFWDVQHVFLEDVERIEVVRGPGATLWGANAVNGVINIVTRDARDTQGTFLTAGGGNYERGFGGFRHGEHFGENGAFRIYGQVFDRDAFPAAIGNGDHDGIQVAQGGFRMDWEPQPTHRLTVQGDVYRAGLDQSYTRTMPPPNPPAPFVDEATNSATGFNLLGRLENAAAISSDWSFQVYYGETDRDTTVFGERRQTFDTDFQHSTFAGDRHRITWGAGHRVTSDRIANTFDITLDPPRRTDHLVSFFVQDEFAVIHDELTLTAGTKLEHNDYTGFEVQPAVRGSWTFLPRQTVWASVARAVRTPARAEHDIAIVQPGGLTFQGNPEFQSEELIAWEAGYRSHPRTNLTFDLSLFLNEYDKLRSLEMASPGVFETGNNLHGRTYGTEVAVNWQAMDFWRWHASYSLLQMDLRARSRSDDPVTVEDTEGRSPRHKAFLRSSMDLPNDWEWDTLFRFADRLTAAGIGSYVEMDIRLAWSPREGLELALVGQNLLKSRHQEFAPSQFFQDIPREIPRSYYGKLSWNF